MTSWVMSFHAKECDMDRDRLQGLVNQLRRELRIASRVKTLRDLSDVD